MIRIMLIVVFVLLTQSPALSAAPEVGTEDYEIMHPYSAWIKAAHNLSGLWCCDIADGRPVQARIRSGWWEVLLTHDKFPSIDGSVWTRVAPDMLVPGENPIGLPIAWVIDGTLRCFVPPSGG